MLDGAGMELDVLRWTGRTSTPKSVEAGRQQIMRNIAQGYLAREACPLQSEFQRPPGAPQGDQPCKTVDRAVGCKHYQAELRRRRDIHEEKERKDADQQASAPQALLAVAKSLSTWSERQQIIQTPDPDVPASQARRPRG